MRVLCVLYFSVCLPSVWCLCVVRACIFHVYRQCVYVLSVPFVRACFVCAICCGQRVVCSKYVYEISDVFSSVFYQ